MRTTLTLRAIPAYAKKMLAGGAGNYVTKNSLISELIYAIREVHRGKKYICSKIKNIISDLNTLTKKQLVVIQKLKLGRSSRQIATDPGIALRTVEAHRYNILKKLNLSNTASMFNFINSKDIWRGHIKVSKPGRNNSFEMCT